MIAESEGKRKRDRERERLIEKEMKQPESESAFNGTREPNRTISSRLIIYDQPTI